MAFDDPKKKREEMAAADQGGAYGFGQQVRKTAGQLLSRAPTAVAAALPMATTLRPAIAAAPTVGEFGRGLTGAPPAAVTPSSSPTKPVAPTRALSAPAASPATAPTPPTPAPSPATGAPAPNPVRPDGVMVSKDAAGNSVYTGTGAVTQAAAGAAPALTRSAPAPASEFVGQDGYAIRALQNSPQALAAGTIAQQTGLERGARAASMSILRPGSEANELYRRFSHVVPTDGSPSGRAAHAAFLGRAQAGDLGAIAAGQQAGNAAANTGLVGAIQGETQQQNLRGQAVLSRIQQQGDQRLQQIRAATDANAPSPMVDASGNVLLRRGTVADAVTGPDGRPVRAAGGQTDPRVQSALIKSAADQLGALALTPTPDPEKDPAGYKAYQDRVAALQAQAAGGNVAGQGDPAAQAMADAKAAIATGKVTADEAKKRLAAAGYSTDGL